MVKIKHLTSDYEAPFVLNNRAGRCLADLCGCGRVCKTWHAETSKRFWPFLRICWLNYKITTAIRTFLVLRYEDKNLRCWFKTSLPGRAGFLQLFGDHTLLEAEVHKGLHDGVSMRHIKVDFWELVIDTVETLHGEQHRNCLTHVFNAQLYL